MSILEPGSPPRDVNVIVDPDNRVTIEWQPPKYTNGDIIGYRVYVTGDPTQPVDQWQIFPMDAEVDHVPHNSILGLDSEVCP